MEDKTSNDTGAALPQGKKKKRTTITTTTKQTNKHNNNNKKKKTRTQQQHKRGKNKAEAVMELWVAYLSEKDVGTHIYIHTHTQMKFAFFST